MHTVTSFRASALQSDRVTSILADYVAVERARSARRLLVARCVPLALCILLVDAAMGGLHPVAYWSSIGLLLTLPLGAWIVELMRTRRLARCLALVSGAETYVVPPVRQRQEQPLRRKS